MVPIQDGVRADGKQLCKEGGAGARRGDVGKEEWVWAPVNRAIVHNSGAALQRVVLNLDDI